MRIYKPKSASASKKRSVNKRSASKPRKSVSKPRKSASKPRKSASKPRKSASKPRKSASKPRKSASKPRKSASKPRKSASKPRKSASKPRKSASKSLPFKKISLKKGVLAGYHINDGVRHRRAILKQHMLDGNETYGNIVKRLNVLAIFNKNNHPEYTKKYREDMAWVQRHLKPLK